MEAEIDQVKSIVESREAAIASTDAGAGTQSLIASGRLTEFRCCYGDVAMLGDSEIDIDAGAAGILGVEPGTSVRHVPR